LLEPSLGDWAHPEGKSFRIGFSIPKKKWPLFGRAKNQKYIISVYQRTCCGANLPENPPKKSGHTQPQQVSEV
jgi:hypothetical protein